MPAAARRSGRRRVSWEATLTHGRATRTVKMLDLSLTGFAASMPEALPVGAQVAIGWMAQESELQCSAVVTRVDPSGDQFITGFEWAELSEADRTQLERLVSERPVVLALEADPELLEELAEVSDEFSIEAADSRERALERLAAGDVSVLLLGESVFGSGCLAFLHWLSDRLPELRTSRVVMLEMTMAGEVASWVNEGRVFAALRAPFSAGYLGQVLRRAVDRFALGARHAKLKAELAAANDRLHRENALLRRRFEPVEGFEGLVGHSPALLEALREASRVRHSDAAVHLFGETGTGKELVARALHRESARRDKPFVAVNCAGLTPSLLQSTLFGHRRGAFTGADRDHAGVFEQADGGTLFLDEVGDLPLDLQATLLRAVQEKEIHPLGSRTPVRVDVRLISATHRDLRAEIASGRFREDLFFRLVVLHLALPPLRERAGDVALLARHFLDKHCELKGREIGGFTPEAMILLEQYRWPGNVRELENEIERLVVLAPDRGLVEAALLSPQLRPQRPVAERVPAPSPSGPEALVLPLDGKYDETIEKLQKELLARALRITEGNLSAAARLLKVERTRLLKLRDRLGL